MGARTRKAVRKEEREKMVEVKYLTYWDEEEQIWETILEPEIIEMMKGQTKSREGVIMIPESMMMEEREFLKAFVGGNAAHEEAHENINRQIEEAYKRGELKELYIV